MTWLPPDRELTYQAIFMTGRHGQKSNPTLKTDRPTAQLKGALRASRSNGQLAPRCVIG
jgi:hypothetical protein